MDAKTLHDLDRLQALLTRLMDQHARLLSLLVRKRDAMRRGDSALMTELCGLENESVRQISELEKHRLELAAAITLAVDPDAAKPLKLGELAEKLPEPHRGKLLVARQQLVQAMEQVRHETSVAKRAAESLVRHVTGVIQTLGALSTGACTYGSRGTAPGAGVPLRTLNLTA